MGRFRDFLVQENFKATKTASRFDRALGDRERVTQQFINDKKKLNANEKRLMRKFFREWKASRGTQPIFEAKFVADVGGVGKTMLYGVELQKRQPPFHVLAIRSSINNSKSFLYTWVRIFTDYNKYSDFVTGLRGGR